MCTQSQLAVLASGHPGMGGHACKPDHAVVNAVRKANLAASVVARRKLRTYDDFPQLAGKACACDLPLAPRQHTDEPVPAL